MIGMAKMGRAIEKSRLVRSVVFILDNWLDRLTKASNDASKMIGDKRVNIKLKRVTRLRNKDVFKESGEMKGNQSAIKS